MSFVKKCDRCGKFYEEHSISNDSKNINEVQTLNLDHKREYYAYKSYDLCPECNDSFMSWLKKKGE